jgi:hypothetical protein
MLAVSSLVDKLSRDCVERTTSSMDIQLDIENCENTADSMMSSYGGTSSLAHFAAKQLKKSSNTGELFFGTATGDLATMLRDAEATGTKSVCQKGDVALVEKVENEKSVVDSCQLFKRWVFIAIAAFVLLAFSLGVAWMTLSFDDGNPAPSSKTDAPTSKHEPLSDEASTKDADSSTATGDGATGVIVPGEDGERADEKQSAADEKQSAETVRERAETVRGQGQTETDEARHVLCKQTACACAGVLAIVGLVATQLWRSSE